MLQIHKNSLTHGRQNLIRLLESLPKDPSPQRRQLLIYLKDESGIISPTSELREFLELILENLNAKTAVRKR